MTNLLDQHDSKDEKGKIEHLEAELERVEYAFEDYITTSEGLEVDVKIALRDMQKRLNESTSAKEELLEKLQNSEGLLETLRISSEGLREKLKSEMKLRREAEKALTERELELRSKTTKIRQLERNDSSILRNVDSGIVTEMVNNTSKGLTDRELQSVTDKLMLTQKRLKIAERKLQRSQRLIQDLERNLENIGNETAENVPRADKELLRELDEIRAEIDAGRGEIESQSDGHELSQEHSFQCQLQLEDCRDEKTRLLKEISCLRSILCDHGATGIIEGIQAPTKSKIISVTSALKTIDEVKEEHHSEIESLRKQIEQVLNENMNLQERLRTFEISSSLVTMSTDEKFKLEDEVQKLKDELHLAHQKLETTSKEKHSMNQIQEEEKVNFDSGEKIETIEDGIIEVKFATDLLPYDANLAADAKLRQSKQMLEESQQECSRMRSEILSITESLYHAKQSHGMPNVSDEVLNARNEVEDKKREITILQNSLMRTQEEVRLLSEEISYMSTAFEKAKDDYNLVVEELHQTKNALAAAKDTKLSQESEIKRLEYLAEKKSRQNAETCLLRTQFQKLNEKNEKLARQIKNAESEILFVREKQQNVREDTNIRFRIVKKLHENIDEVVRESHQRNLEVEELALMIENRMRTAEKDFGTLQSEIVIAMKTLRTDELASSGEKTKQLQPINQDDPSFLKSNPVEIGEFVDKDMKSDIINELESPLEYSRSLGESLNTSKNMTNQAKSGQSDHEDQLNGDDRTTITTSLKKNKYEEIIRRVAKYQSFSLRIKGDREFETRGDIEVEERE